MHCRRRERRATPVLGVEAVETKPSANPPDLDSGFFKIIQISQRAIFFSRQLPGIPVKVGRS